MQYRPLQAGEHLLQQVTSDFSYLRQREQAAPPASLAAHHANPFLLEKVACRS